MTMHQLHQKTKAQATQAAALMMPRRTGEMILKHALALSEIIGLADKKQTIILRWMYASVTHDGRLHGMPPIQATV